MSQTALQNLASTLAQELSGMTAFTVLLKQEEQALLNTDTEALQRITFEKNQLIQQLVQLEKIRLSELSQLNLSTDHTGMQDLLASLNPAQNHALESTWNALLNVSMQAKNANHTNGILINRQLSKNHGALNILQKNNPVASMYGPTGQSTQFSTINRAVVLG